MGRRMLCYGSDRLRLWEQRQPLQATDAQHPDRDERDIVGWATGACVCHQHQDCALGIILALEFGSVEDKRQG